ncbi:MAG: hypothetical protein HC836_29490 [Richelia sp. RM2_1_2]|nr:hypothetical protein [Richelia sp. RM2_1_2]
MSRNSFISARVPSEVFKQLEFHAKTTGESKSKILLKALDKYLENPTDSSDSNKRIKSFEWYMNERLKDLESEVEKLDKNFFYRIDSLAKQVNQITSWVEKIKIFLKENFNKNIT